MRPLAFGCGNAEVNGGFLGRQFYPFDLFQFFDPALNLFGFGGLRAKAIDERFQLLNPVALVFVRRFELRQPFRFLTAEFFITAGVET